jgi:hypothetical protein
LRVGALLVDYDGTIAPLGVPRNESRILRHVDTELRRIVKLVPVCVVTAKDFEFVYPKSSFATAWACVSGLDVRLADGRRSTRKRLRNLDQAVRVAELGEKKGTITELKRGPSGELLAVAIDWSGVPELGPSLLQSLRQLANAGFIVSHESLTTFADIFAAQPDKGRATRLLCNLLQVENKSMFIGDSALDNSAFQEADIGIGVDHGQPTDGLTSDFVVDQAKLAGFLRTLNDHGMDFAASLPGLRKRERRSRES